MNKSSGDTGVGTPDTKRAKKDVTQAALRRWNILKEVLLSGRSVVLDSDSAVSVRRFKSYNLLQTQLINKDQDQCGGGDWYTYTSKLWPDFKMEIRHLSSHVSPEALKGFNNTGNVCVWPSEEVLTYYCLNNIPTFKDKNVIELGGGMTCLAGVALSVTSEASYIELTDGNEDSVSNLEMIIERNKPQARSQLSSRMLRWGSGPLDEDLLTKFDIVLCADCLFFKDGREDLIRTVDGLLKPDGVCIMVAPLRGETFNEFVCLARDTFTVNVQENFDDHFWDIHCKLQEKGIEVYDSNIHYPWLLTLTKAPVSRENSSER